MAPQNNNNGLAVAALVLGIISIVLCFVPFLSAILAILAIIFGIIALKSARRGMAIAGLATGILGLLLGILIFAMIFIGIPALQRSQRDTGRKADVSLASTEVVDFMTNYRGELPEASWLDGLDYSVIDTVSGGGVPSSTIAVYTPGVNCDGTESARAYRIVVGLESGGDYCMGS